MYLVCGELDHWLGWEETCFIAAAFGLPVVSVIRNNVAVSDKKLFEQEFWQLAQQPSVFASVDVQTQQPCTLEVVVTRNADMYAVDDFAKNVFKYVRKGRVKRSYD